MIPVTSGIKLTAFHEKKISPTVKLGGGSVMVLSYFAASVLRKLAIIDGTMNSVLYQKLLKENVFPSVSTLKLEITCYDNVQKNIPVLAATRSTSRY